MVAVKTVLFIWNGPAGPVEEVKGPFDPIYTLSFIDRYPDEVPKFIRGWLEVPIQENTDDIASNVNEPSGADDISIIAL